MIRWLGAEMEHARECEWYGKLPQGFAKMKERACFGNAQQLVIKREGLRYAEGEAWKQGMWKPVHHAWVINDQDKAIDVTWTKRDQAPRIYRAAVIAGQDELCEHIITQGARFYYPYMCCMSDWCWCINLLEKEE